MPYSPPKVYQRAFAPTIPGAPFRSLSFKDLDTWAQDGEKDPNFVHQAGSLYDAEIAYTDRLIGGLLDHLRSTGLAQHVCVVLTSDHGEEFGEHGDLFHGRVKLYQEIVSVPLLVWCPGRFVGGRVSQEPVGVVDTVPTLLELAGLAVPTGLDGVSLVPQLCGETAPSERVLESDADFSLANWSKDSDARLDGFVLALRKGHYKVIYDSTDESRRLFDLDTDPAERNDLATARPDILADFEPYLAAAVARRGAGSRAPLSTEVDPNVREQLRALGYLE